MANKENFNINEAIDALKEYSGKYGKPEEGKPRKALLHEDLMKNVTEFMKEYYGDRPCDEDPENCGTFVIQALPAEYLPEIKIEDAEDAELPPLAGHQPLSIMFGRDPSELAIAVSHMMANFATMFTDPKKAMELLNVQAGVVVKTQQDYWNDSNKDEQEKLAKQCYKLLEELEINKEDFAKHGKLRSASEE